MHLSYSSDKHCTTPLTNQDFFQLEIPALVCSHNLEHNLRLHSKLRFTPLRAACASSSLRNKVNRTKCRLFPAASAAPCKRTDRLPAASGLAGAPSRGRGFPKAAFRARQWCSRFPSSAPSPNHQRWCRGGDGASRNQTGSLCAFGLHPT